MAETVVPGVSLGIAQDIAEKYPLNGKNWDEFEAGCRAHGYGVRLGDGPHGMAGDDRAIAWRSGWVYTALTKERS